MNDDKREEAAGLSGSGVQRWVRRLVCAVASHEWRVVRKMNPGSRKVACDRCGGCWAMHDPTQTLVPWDDEFEAMYAPGGPLDPATDPRWRNDA